MIDDRQFIVTKDAIKKSDWKSIQLKNGFTLNYHKDLNVVSNADCSAVLLGHAWSVISATKTPEDIIKEYSAETSTERIISDEKTWCGRYVLIVGNLLFLDANGLLGVFYNKKKNVLSSSIRLMCDYCGEEVKTPNIHKKAHPCFVPGMYTGYDDTFRLLPSQILHLPDMVYEVRPLLPDGIVATANDAARIQNFIDAYTLSLKNMANHFKGYQVAFALSGGKDCRTVLAVLERTGINYSVFTAEHGDISAGDIYIPKRIAKTLKRPYRFIKRRKENFSQQRYEDFRTHTAGFSVDEDWNFHAYGQYAELPPKTIILRGGVFEMTGLYYESVYCPDGKFSIRKIYRDMDTKPDYDKAISEYMAYVEADEVNRHIGINIFDRVCWELLGGCWLSAVEQSFDMMDGIVSVQSCNSRFFMSLLMGFTDAKRLTKAHQVEITTAACPVLGTIPYADDDFKTFYPFIPMMKRRIANKLFLIRQKLGL